MSAPAPQPAAEFRLGRIAQIAVNVHDVERATRFYRDVLGMPLLFQAPPGLAFFDCGGVRLMLAKPEGAGTPHGTSIVYYAVADIAAAHAKLAARGVAFAEPPHVVARLPERDVWLAVFHDSEGNLLGLMSEVPRRS
ncbi:MAG TPA: VOC family protein [Gemmatimonadales bacterium]|jgi:methylmalonyl-CoA/ethylmalonyl-CoA epimerase|nr:VOC family protein [Gemmatimonadales bacterium]